MVHPDHQVNNQHIMVYLARTRLHVQPQALRK